MWIISVDGSGGSDDGSCQYWLCPSRQQYTVGRKSGDCNIIVADELVSRVHCVLMLDRYSDSLKAEEAAAEYQHSRLTVMDRKSSHGTLIEPLARTVTATKEYPLNDGDSLLIGRVRLRIRRQMIVLCTSQLPVAHLQSIMNNSRYCDYTVVKEWSESCTHLVMSALVPSLKAIRALQSGAFIVNEQWLKRYMEYSQSVRNISDRDRLPDFKEPDPTKYLPRVAENTFDLESCSWLPNPGRKTLFENCHFYMFNQLGNSNPDSTDRVRTLIEGSSGKLSVIASSDFAKTINSKNPRNIIYFIEPIPESAYQYLTGSVHSIDENLIGMAIVKIRLPHLLQSALTRKSTTNQNSFIHRPSVIPDEAFEPKIISSMTPLKKLGDQNLFAMNSLRNKENVITNLEKDENPFSVPRVLMTPRSNNIIDMPRRSPKKCSPQKIFASAASDIGYALEGKKQRIQSDFRIPKTNPDQRKLSDDKYDTVPALSPDQNDEITCVEEKRFNSPPTAGVWLECPKTKQTVESKMNSVIVPGLVSKSLLSAGGNTKKFVKKATIKKFTGSMPRIIGLDDLKPSDYKISAGAHEPWLFEHNKRRR